MASGQRVVHQDYIARIRYSNALPPPPNPPKLLEVPGTGLVGGEYTSATYASRLTREQPLNIEADAELGMHIDLIGVPGIFDGDERAISARPNPRLHPHDKELLKPLSALGKGAGVGGAVSFLRRTEYTSSQGPQHLTSSTGKDVFRVRNDAKRRKLNVNKDDPINIIRNIVKGFDVAYPRDAYTGEDNTTSIRGAAITDPEVKAWSTPQHPSKPKLELLDSYPVLPDLEALPSTACYVVTKFITNPVAASDVYDDRLDIALLRPKDDPRKEAEFQQKLAEWDSASTKPEPLREFDYDYFLPIPDNSSVRNIKRKLDVNDPENEDAALYTDDLGDDQRAFKYARVRTYETYSQHGNPNNFYNDSVALALHDPDLAVGAVPGAKHRLIKGAYFYPVIQRTALRPKRNVGGLIPQKQDDEKVDEINLTIGDMDEDSRAAVQEKMAALDPSLAVEA